MLSIMHVDIFQTHFNSQGSFIDVFWLYNYGILCTEKLKTKLAKNIVEKQKDNLTT